MYSYSYSSFAPFKWSKQLKKIKRSKVSIKGLKTTYQSVEPDWQVPYPLSPWQWGLTLPIDETPVQWSHWSGTPLQCHCERTHRQHDFGGRRDHTNLNTLSDKLIMFSTHIWSLRQSTVYTTFSLELDTLHIKYIIYIYLQSIHALIIIMHQIYYASDWQVCSDKVLNSKRAKNRR